MEMTKENLVDLLTDYFSLNDSDGTYTYQLTRVKSAFSYGTMSFDDFQEFNEENVEDLANYLWDRFSKQRIQGESKWT